MSININYFNFNFEKNKESVIIQKTFIILSSCMWGDMLQRPHHMARALSRLGHEVHFLMCGFENAETDSLEYSTEESVSFSINNRQIIDDVNIYIPLNVIYKGNALFNNRLELIQFLTNNSKNDVIFIVYFPSYITLIKNIKGNFKIVYDCVDDHNDLEYSYWSCKQDIEWEQQLCDISDVVLTTSYSLYLSKAVIENRDNIYLSKNAVNIEDFNADNSSEPEEIVNIPKPRVSYVGAVDKWFNEDLFYRIVRANRDKSFIVIGPVREGMLQNNEENLYLLGVKQHKYLKNYLINSDLGIIPFKDNIDLITNCNPIKLYEYLSCGLPVAASNLPELALNKDFIRISSSFESFNKAVNELISYKAIDEEVSDFIKENTWNVRARQLIDILDYNIGDNNKSKVILKMRKGFEDTLTYEQNFSINSLYGLTFLNYDNLKFLEYTRQGYLNSKTRLSFRNYVYALSVNKHFEQAVRLLMSSEVIDSIYQEELSCFSFQDTSILDFLINLCIKNYGVLKSKINALQPDYKQYYSACYHYVTDNQDECTSIIIDLLKEPNKYRKLPIFNAMLLKFSLGGGMNLMEKAASKAKELELRFNLLEEHVPHYIKEFISNTLCERRPKFSIVIPTRNNADTLNYTLKTCLEQDYEDYEIVIADNSSNNATFDMLQNIISDKVKYYKTHRELPMTYNFNFAISKAKGDYILVLGSDDALLFHALKTLDEILRQKEYNVLRWDLAAYGWPEVKLKGYENCFVIPSRVDKSISMYSLENVIERVINYETRYSLMPMMYCNAVVSRNLVLKIIERTHKIYDSLAPDVYSGFIISYLEKEYETVNLPMTIGGSSHRSNGIACIFTKEKDTAIKKDFFSLYKENGYKFYGNIPLIKTENMYVAESFLRAKDNLFKDDNRYNLDMNKFINASVSSLYDDDEELFDHIEKIKQSINEDSKLKAWFYDNYVNNGFRGFKRPAFGYSIGFNFSGGLTLDASDFGVNNVYEAAKLFRKLTGI